MTKLYEITESYRQVSALVEDTSIDPQALTDTLEGITGDLSIKATNVAMMVKNLEAVAEAIDEAITQMQHRRGVLLNRAASVRHYIKLCMERAEITKIDCPFFALAIKKNPPRVVIDSEDQIPAEYMRVPDLPQPEPDKKLIGAALKEKKDVPGARLETGTRLEIK